MGGSGKKEHRWENRTVVLSAISLVVTLIWARYGNRDLLGWIMVIMLWAIFIVHGIARIYHLRERHEHKGEWHG